MYCTVRNSCSRAHSESPWADGRELSRRSPLIFTPLMRVLNYGWLYIAAHTVQSIGLRDMDSAFASVIEYKAKLAGITGERVDEPYTSQTGPQCGRSEKPSGRSYSCGECGFHGHRNCVGAANSRREYVGQTCLPGVMDSPSGVRFHPHLSCSSLTRRKTSRQPA